MKKIINNIIRIIQITLLLVSYYVFNIFRVKKIKDSWIISGVEIANMLKSLSILLEPAITVCFRKNNFYNNNYNFNKEYKSKICNILFYPLLLGYLSANYNKFWYIWSKSYLKNRDDEFKFLKKRKKLIISMFLGSEIRSPYLLKSYIDKNQIDHYINYIQDKTSTDINKENKLKELCSISEKYSKIVFSFKYCQMSYLQKISEFLPYIIENDNFYSNQEKFSDLSTVRILHAPSSPVIKGTQLVRAAIKKLILLGYKIDYIELQNVNHDIVKKELKKSHIVLNQFYSFLPGMFGVEAMASNCAVLMSADPMIETVLPNDIENAWLITKYWEIFDNIKYLLDNKNEIKVYAKNGFEYSNKHFNKDAVKKQLKMILANNGIN